LRTMLSLFGAISPVAAIRGEVEACLRSARLATLSSVVQFASKREAALNTNKRVICLPLG